MGSKTNLSCSTSVGIDLSGPANQEDTALVVTDRQQGHIEVVESVAGASDREIIQLLKHQSSRAGSIAVGIDAPLSYEPGGGLRQADTELRAYLVDNGYDPQHVMPPTLTQMAYLALRGIALSRWISQQDGVQLAETHPYTALAARGADAETLAEHKHSAQARERLREVLTNWGVKKLPSDIRDSDHLIAASAAAVAVADWQFGASMFCYQADPPTHPFPLVC